MARSKNWTMFLGILLVCASALVYYIHFLIFHDLHHIMIYLIGDIAFVFLEVLLVTLIIHRLMIVRERQTMFKKLNMVIGAFFSEVGIGLLKIIIPFDKTSAECGKSLARMDDLPARAFDTVRRKMSAYEPAIDTARGNPEALKTFLIGRRQFVLVLLENPNLLEHESFTNMLWAVFHLADELSYRPGFGELPSSDFEHLSGDIKRVYRLLVLEWISYMKHLKEDYPYLFSLALRTNPFDPDSSAVVRAKA